MSLIGQGYKYQVIEINLLVFKAVYCIIQAINQKDFKPIKRGFKLAPNHLDLYRLMLYNVIQIVSLIHTFY